MSIGHKMHEQRKQEIISALRLEDLDLKQDQQGYYHVVDPDGFILLKTLHLSDVYNWLIDPD